MSSAVVLGTRCTDPCTGTVSQVFQAKIVRDSMPFVSGSGKTVSLILWGEAGWIERIFDGGAYKAKQAHVDAFF